MDEMTRAFLAACGNNCDADRIRRSQATMAGKPGERVYGRGAAADRERASRIRQARRALGWTQSELAQKAGLTRQLVQHVERGDAVLVGAGRVARLEATLGVAEAQG